MTSFDRYRALTGHAVLVNKRTGLTLRANLEPTWVKGADVDRLLALLQQMRYVCGQALGAFEKNWCIDWNELDTAISETDAFLQGGTDGSRETAQGICGTGPGEAAGDRQPWRESGARKG